MGEGNKRLGRKAGKAGLAHYCPALLGNTSMEYNMLFSVSIRVFYRQISTCTVSYCKSFAFSMWEIICIFRARIDIPFGLQRKDSC